MAEKEERILITKCSSWCHARRMSCDPFDDKDGMYCDKSGKWVRITEKECAKCKDPVLLGISRQEAIECMAKAICRRENLLDSCYHCMFYYKKQNGEMCKEILTKREDDMEPSYIDIAEAALDALLGA